MTSEGERVSDYQVKTWTSVSLFLFWLRIVFHSLGISYPESGKSGMAVWRKTVRNWRGEIEQKIDAS
jgi:hypothetical protein